MKIISCYVENFGALKKTEYSFGDGVTTILKDNGEGKTTLAAFIKAMLYGMPQVRKTTKDFNDRMHFYPFGGGKFGGNMTFTAGGKTYRVERFFDEKSETKDKCKIEIDGEEKELNDSLGKTVFGIEAEDFARTAFITTEIFDGPATPTINAKLNNFVDDTDGENDYEEAMKWLGDRARELKNAKGGNGLIKSNRDEKKRREEERENLRAIDAQMDGLYAKSKAMEKEIAENEKALAEAKKIGERRAKREDYKHRMDQVKAADERMKELSDRYGGKIPSTDEAAKLSDDYGEFEKAKREYDGSAFPADRAKRLEEYSVKFSGGAPSEEAIRRAEQKAEEIGVENERLSREKDDFTTEREQALKRRFDGRVPSESRMAELDAAADAYREKENALKRSATQKPVAVKKNPVYAIVFVVALIAAAGGAGLLFVNVAAGVALIAVGVVALAADGFLYLKNSINKGGVGEYGEMTEELKRAESSLRAKLATLGADGEDVMSDYNELKRDVADYNDYAARQEIRAEKAENLRRSILTKEEEYKSLLAAAHIEDGDRKTLFVNLRRDIAEFNDLKEEKKRSDERLETIREKAAEYSAAVKKFFAERKMYVEDGNVKARVGEAVRDAAFYEKYFAERSEKYAEAEKFKLENDVGDEEETAEINFDEIAARLSALRNEKTANDREIDENDRKLERLPEVSDEIEELDVKIKELEAEYDLIKTVEDYVEKAEQNLRNKYVKPIRDKFLTYAEKIESVLGEKMSMNKDFSVEFERGGENKSERHLSAGQRSVCSLCVRLALIDNMYEKEKPFVIMDDPFVHLDEKHFEKVKKAVKELSLDTQTIYFTCHKSRVI